MVAGTQFARLQRYVIGILGVAKIGKFSIITRTDAGFEIKRTFLGKGAKAK